MLFATRRSDPPAMTLEGVLGPNTRLDDAAGIAVDAPNAVCVIEGLGLLFSSGSAVLAIEAWDARPTPWAVFDDTVTAIGGGPDGLVAVGLAGGGLAVCDRNGAAAGWTAPAAGPAAIADLAFLPDGAVAAVDSGYGPGDDMFARAPWDDRARGSVTSVRRDGATRQLASGLHCPTGIALDGSGAPLVTLFERAAVAELSGQLRQSGYPAYPGRIRRTDTGYLIACLARRDPLIEFLKTERDFVAEMKQSIEPRYWISPRMHPEFSHDFPIEAGATRLFGEIKPWAPSFSYGLVIETDERLVPTASAHSRANGLRHAISDAVCWNGDIIAVSRASGEVLRIGAGGTVQ
ncbi:hypothetical protein [Hoeflea alexandrii]|uniref:hypothetical protein n=1 Tax=Hoeflea alexandrii TaxID=288436 RepID=UPI0022AF36EE|nr:hypothetical protein [Hoeflea alexandrii]MCZ4291229.1 hypothetical protein [Hoeflea alexandrii]